MIANRPYLYISNDIILCQNFIKVILLKYILNGNGGKELAMVKGGGSFVYKCRHTHAFMNKSKWKSWTFSI